VNTIAIQVPTRSWRSRATRPAKPVIGVWSDTERQSMRLTPGKEQPFGQWVQVSRLGHPLINEVIVAAGMKDQFNSQTPDVDRKIPEPVARVTDPELARLIQAIYGIPAPPTPRNDLVEIFLTGITTKAGGPIQADLNSQLNNADVDPKRFEPSEMLRLNTSIPPAANPNRLGVLANDLQGFPNGRRLTDDVVDISIQAVEGAAVSGIVQPLAAGDKVDANNVPFGAMFPYIALPNNTAVSQQSGAGAPPGGSTPSGGGAPPAGGAQLLNGSGPLPFGAPIWVPFGVGAALLLGAGGFVVLRRRSRPFPTEQPMSARTQGNVKFTSYGQL
jgi:Domain of unknown function (DUF4331)